MLTNVGMSFATAWQPGSSAQYPLLYKYPILVAVSHRSPIMMHRLVLHYKGPAGQIMQCKHERFHTTVMLQDGR